MEETLIPALQAMIATAVAIYTVPLTQQLKKWVKWIDRRRAWMKQLLAIGVAGALTTIVVLIDVALPVDLVLFGEPEVAALLSGIGAWAIKAGQQSNQRKS